MKGMFSSEIDSNALDTAWNGIRARRVRRRVVRRASLVSSIVGALALALLFFFHRPHAPEAIALASGAALPAEWVARAPEIVTFDDGSRLEIGARTTLRTVARTATRVDLALESGSTTFDVVPGGPRAWAIDAGGGTVVRVLGTRFTVTRDGERVQVSVERGKVRVESPKITGGKRDLVAGEEVDVGGPPPSAAPSASPVIVPVPVIDATDAKTTRPSKKSASPVQATPDPTADPMTRADTARSEGRPREAAAILGGVVDAGDPRAALAAFTIGKIHAEELGEPGVAATWFERAMRIGLPAALDEDAQARVAESYGRAGRTDEAALAASRYESRFPNGRHLARVRRWLRE